MSEKMLSQKVLKESYAVNDEGVIVKVFEIDERKYAVPTGNIVGNEDAMIDAINTQLNYLYYRELFVNLDKAKDSRDKKVKAFESGKATREEVDTANRKVAEASARASYYADEVTNAVPERDDVAMLIAMTITGSGLINIDKASKMLSSLRIDKLSDADVKKVVLEYLTENVRLADAPYFKPYETRVKDKAIPNLRKLATMYTLKYTKKGITENYMKDKKVFYQIMLELFRDAFKLTVEQSNKAEALLNM